MKIEEKKEMVERIVATKYIAEDGTVFCDKEECLKYEQSALFAISKQLKRLTNNKHYASEINDCFSEEEEIEIFDIQTEEDLKNLKQYLYLVAQSNGASETSIEDCFSSEKFPSRKDFVFDNVTIGHEVLIFWNYEKDWFWTYRDGSFEGYLSYFKDQLHKLIEPANEAIEN